MTSNPIRRLIAALLVAVIGVGPAQLSAQEPVAEDLVTPTDAQQDYNDQGVVLIQDGKYKQAIASFRSSISLGELNITYLNLGRAYFRLDRCLEAREAYDSVRSSPKVKAPTPSEIQDILNRFEAEYAETCASTIALTCEGNPMVSVGDQPARPCAEVSAWPVVAGSHTVKAVYDTGETEREVRVDPRSAAAISFETPEVVVETAPDPIEIKPTSTATPTYVWITIGSGAALLAAALVLDLVVIGGQLAELEDLEGSTDGADVDAANALRDDVDTMQTVSLITAGVGAAVLITGGILWLVSGDEPTATAVGPWVSEDAAGVVLQGSF